MFCKFKDKLKQYLCDKTIYSIGWVDIFVCNPLLTKQTFLQLCSYLLLPYLSRLVLKSSSAAWSFSLTIFLTLASKFFLSVRIWNLLLIISLWLFFMFCSSSLDDSSFIRCCIANSLPCKFEVCCLAIWKVYENGHKSFKHFNQIDLGFNPIKKDDWNFVLSYEKYNLYLDLFL